MSQMAKYSPMQRIIHQCSDFQDKIKQNNNLKKHAVTMVWAPKNSPIAGGRALRPLRSGKDRSHCQRTNQHIPIIA